MSNEEKLLIKLLGLFTFTTSTANIFLGLFLFSLGGFKIVATFYLQYFIFILAAYLLSGWTLKRISSSQGIQIGLLLYSISYLLLVVLGKNAGHYLPLLSTLFGLASGTFWSGNNLSQYILTNEKSRNEYFSKSNALLSLVTTLGPLVGGCIISLFALRHLATVGYLTVFGFVGTLMFCVALIAGRLPYHSNIRFSPNQLFHHASKSWHLVLIQQFILGLYDVAFGSLSGIIVFLIVKTELRVGIVNAMCCLTYTIVSYYLARIIGRYKKSYIIGMVGVSLGIFLFGYFHNLVSIAILVAMIYGLSPFVNTPTSKAMLDTIDGIPGSWQEKYHFLIERDTALGIGRILSYAILLSFLTIQNSLTIVTTWILCIAVIPAIVAVIQTRLTALPITEKMTAQGALNFATEKRTTEG